MKLKKKEAAGKEEQKVLVDKVTRKELIKRHKALGISGLRSPTVYNNYMKMMKKKNKERQKQGLDAIYVRTYEEWLSD